MSKTIKGSKGPFFEYWGKRLGNKKGNLYSAGRKTKKTTLKRERAAAKASIHSALND